MIRVTIGNNLKRSSENYTPDTTLRAAMEQAGIDYTSGMTTLDEGAVFVEMGCERLGSKLLVNIAKADGVTVEGGY